MAINPFRYVMAPRLIAAMVSIPLLTAVFNVVGLFGGYIVGVLIKGISGMAYLQSMKEQVDWSDVQMSIIKSFLFALVIIWISMGKGFFVHLEKQVSGAEAVSKVTTEAVVASAISMLFVDYIASSFLI
jgi:phospholipid/cholesterol/gamma-HCH transport system permease protein